MHVLDLDRVRAAVAACVTPYERQFRRPGVPREAIESDIDRAIVATSGPWARGWRWSPTEPGGGGPARGWCCARDSVFRDDDRDAMQTVERAIGALADWRAFLELLDRTFALLRLETGALELAKEVEVAASRLLALVVERTQGEDAWYSTFASTLVWYLEAAGIADAAAHRVVAETIRGRFESWITPDEDAARETCGELGRIVGERAGPGEPRDALADWLVVRAQPIAVAPVQRLPDGQDAHSRYIETHDRARGADRADRIAAALLLARDSATRGMALSFDQLAEWQRVVLGAPGPVPFRTTDAFAKRGRERYAIRDGLVEQFDQALASASDPAVDIAVRAARVYLDVCFFHPFADGNARAARLALDHVLTSAGLVLGVAEPVFAVARGADDPHGLWGLAFVIERSIRAR